MDKYELEAKRWVYLWKQTGPYISLGITEISCINTGPPTAARHLKWDTIESENHPLIPVWADVRDIVIEAYELLNWSELTLTPGLMAYECISNPSVKKKTPETRPTDTYFVLKVILHCWRSQPFKKNLCLHWHSRLCPLFRCLCTSSLIPVW